MSKQAYTPNRGFILAIGLLLLVLATLSNAVKAQTADPDGSRAGAVTLDANAAARKRQFIRGLSLDRENGDTVDYFTFTSTARYELGLGVRDQRIDLDVTLEDASGNTIIQSWPPPVDSTIEWLKTVIEPGTYYIRVEAMEDGATNYYVRFGLKTAPSETATPTATTTDTPTAIPTPELTPTPTDTATPLPTETPTDTHRPQQQQAAQGTATPTVTPTATSTATTVTIATATPTPTSTMTATSAEDCGPNAPTLTIIPTIVWVEGSIVVTWNTPVNHPVSHYILTRTHDDNGVTSTRTFRIDGSATRFIDNDLEFISYDYVLTACRAEATVTVTPTASSTAIPYATATPTATSTATAIPVATATPTSTSTATPLASAVPTASSTATPVNALTPTPTSTTVSVAACSVSDRAVLVALYNGTGGSDWVNSENWLSDEPLGDWHGVTTDENGCVKRLILSRNGLNGAIPSELGSLSNLVELWLPRNELSGAIPSQLGNLSNLEVLLLFDNDLSGSIPSQLGSLSNLEWLVLGQNNLTGSVPASLGNLSNLEILILSYNELSGSIPAELDQLTNLSVAQINGNSFTGGCIPTEWKSFYFEMSTNTTGLEHCDGTSVDIR